jgi:hypothetical protein
MAQIRPLGTRPVSGRSAPLAAVGRDSNVGNLALTEVPGLVRIAQLLREDRRLGLLCFFLHRRWSPRCTNFRKPSRSERFASPVDPEDAVGFGCYFRSMGDVDSRKRKLLQIAVDLRLLVEVQVRRPFIKEKDFRLAEKGACEQ